MTAFDEQVYEQINRQRWAFFEPMLQRLKSDLHVRTVLDVGAGAGYFAQRIAELGFDVTAADGRQENVDVIRRRLPGIHAEVVDIQKDGALDGLGSFDLVFCAGLLYHLDNPVAGVSNLARHAAPYVLIETQVAPGQEAAFRMVEEGCSVTQGLKYLALVATTNALVRLLELGGRPFVYETTGGPDHPQFHESVRYYKLRRIFLASTQQVGLPGLERVCSAPAGKGFHAKPVGLAKRAILRAMSR